MSLTTGSIFGTEPTGEPATPSSYGEAPSGFRLPATTSVERVTLQVADLGRSLEFYRSVLGLAELGRDRGEALLGAGSRPLVELRERPDAGPSGRGRLGLFHFAILLPDRPALGRFVRHLADLDIYAGAGTTWSAKRSTSPIRTASASRSMPTGRCSPLASFATGQTFVVDGGHTAH